VTAYRRIFCPIDFSEYSCHALDQAVAIGRSCGGSVKAMHALHPIPYTDPLLGATLYTPVGCDRTLRDLDQFVRGEIGHAPVQTSVVEGHPTGATLREAARLRATLIVRGIHRRGGFERFLLGSVTERVLRNATCPVLPEAWPEGVFKGRRVGGGSAWSRISPIPSTAPS